MAGLLRECVCCCCCADDDDDVAGRPDSVRVDRRGLLALVYVSSGRRSLVLRGALTYVVDEIGTTRSALPLGDGYKFIEE